MSLETAEQAIPRHPVRLVSRRTGLSAHVLRVWERRYGVVQPGRSAGGQRLYSDADIERLRLLHQATLSGRNIGQLVDLSNDSLSRLLRQDAEAEPSQAAEPQHDDQLIEAAALLELARAAVPRFDARALEDVFQRALLGLGVASAFDHVVVPFLQEIGAAWERSEIGPAHEHLSSAVVRRVLDGVLQRCTPPPRAPVLVVATPPGEAHELGALLAAATATAEGWRVIYLGSDLPLSDIARAAAHVGAHAAGISIIHAPNHDEMAAALDVLARELPAGCRLLLGGGAAHSLIARMGAENATLVADLAELRALLARRPRPAPKST